ncbi:MAG TPA: hypothetical protein VHX52_08285 [Steroidobacteraceae bacterium]|jgi:hypothetical protein|nr:hypothetical protein [Steroidobacteraceae bacterium]
MTGSIVLVASWRDGVRLISDGAVRQELIGQPVAGLAGDGRGGALAIVGGKSLCRRPEDGRWSTLATSEMDLSCCVACGTDIYVGTDTAQVLRARQDGGLQDGGLERLAGFDQTPGRERWYCGAALIDGRLVGPPLGIRSIATSCDQATLLANVHVGGIPRSIDGGATWQPSIDIDADVHQVCAHPTRAGLIIAAAAAGLCISHDGGQTWTIEREGLHAPYCSAVAFAGDDILVAASTDHFAAQGALYRRALAGGRLLPVRGGLPTWLDGIADTGNIAVRGASVAVADRGGNLYLSADAGGTWMRAASAVPTPSSVLIP